MKFIMKCPISHAARQDPLLFVVFESAMIPSKLVGSKKSTLFHPKHRSNIFCDNLPKFSTLHMLESTDLEFSFSKKGALFYIAFMDLNLVGKRAFLYVEVRRG